VAQEQDRRVSTTTQYPSRTSQGRISDSRKNSYHSTTSLTHPENMKEAQPLPQSCYSCPDRYCLERGEGYPGRFMFVQSMEEFPRLKIIYLKEDLNRCIIRTLTIQRSMEELVTAQQQAKQPIPKV